MIKFLISIFLWPIWFSYTFIALITIFILIMIVPHKKLYVFLRPICWFWCFFGGQILKRDSNIPLKINQPYIYMFNHASMFDQFMIGAYINHYLTAVAAIEIFKYPLWGQVLNRYGIIPIYRKKIKKALSSLYEAEKKILSGVSILIAPEGTRTTDGKLGEFKKGPFHLAKNSGATIIPVGLIGAFDAKKKTDWRIKPGQLIVKFGDPITSGEYSKMSIIDLRDLVRNRINQLIH